MYAADQSMLVIDRVENVVFCINFSDNMRSCDVDTQVMFSVM